MPETIPHSNQKRSFFRNSQSLGSIASIFSTPKKNKQQEPNKLQTSRKQSKSEEVLDSPKMNYEDSDVSDTEEISDPESEEPNKDDVVSPFTAKRYLK